MMSWFWNLLIRNNLQERPFAQAVGLLAQRSLILKNTIVDSISIELSSSTKHQNRKEASLQTQSQAKRKQKILCPFQGSDQTQRIRGFSVRAKG